MDLHYCPSVRSIPYNAYPSSHRRAYLQKHQRVREFVRDLPNRVPQDELASTYISLGAELLTFREQVQDYIIAPGHPCW